MYNNIIFIGGVHGVGKGTICQKIKEKLDFTHLSASEVLKWDDFKNEKGDNINMYIVKTGDNLLSIARNELGCHTKYAELVEVNKLESTIIYPGQVLRFKK